MYTHSNETSDEASESLPLCFWEPAGYITEQYWLIAVFGCTVSVIGICFNIALLQVLFQRKLRTTYLIYLAVLAIMDILILITYVLVPVVGVLYEYYHSYFLYRFWHTYVQYFYTISRLVTLAGTYLVLACTVERYWEVVQLHNPRPNSTGMTQSKRYAIIALVLLITLAFRSVVVLELSVETRPECQGTMAYVALRRTELVENYFYSEIYSFWCVHVIQVFFPFPALIFLNVLIMFTWRSLLKNRRKASIEMKRFIERSQSARKMMVSIVTSYLICNTLQMVITCWEHLNMDYLKSHDDFYAFASDVVTLLTAISATLRLPIYYASNSTIRLAIQELWLSKRVQEIVRAGSFRKKDSTQPKSSLRRQNSVKKRSLRQINSLPASIVRNESSMMTMIDDNQNSYKEPIRQRNSLQELMSQKNYYEKSATRKNGSFRNRHPTWRQYSPRRKSILRNGIKENGLLLVDNV